MTTLPQPRQLLTSLINSITAIPHPPQPDPTDRARTEGPSNPLQAIPHSHRHLLTTLHVLFPTLLLPALDLLDNGLVTRLIPDFSTGATPGAGPQPRHPAAAGTSGTCYLVRSAAASSLPSHSHRQRSRHQPSTGSGTAAAAVAGAVAGGSAANHYVARLGAWNCTCAAFTFAAFPPGGGIFSDREPEPGPEPGLAEDCEVNEGRSRSWSFGGSSLGDRRGGDGEEGGVPCCKHLLACLLAERWEAALGRYVAERRVGREEMAGIVADV